MDGLVATDAARQRANARGCCDGTPSRGGGVKSATGTPTGNQIRETEVSGAVAKAAGGQRATSAEGRQEESPRPVGQAELCTSCSQPFGLRNGMMTMRPNTKERGIAPARSPNQEALSKGM